MDPSPPVRLGLFAKHWAPGRSKTRLAATVGETVASTAAKRFLEVTTWRLASLRGDRLLACTPRDQLQDFASLRSVSEGGWGLEAQPDSPSLGQRMAWFFRRALTDGMEAAVLVGSDSPDLPIAAVERALEWLTAEGPDDRLVFGPTSDGGYWLIGARGELGPVFDDMPWSRPELMSETIRTLQSAGWRRGREFELVAEWYDVDTAGDLADLCGRIEADPASDEVLKHLAEDGRRWLAGPHPEH